MKIILSRKLLTASISSVLLWFVCATAWALDVKTDAETAEITPPRVYQEALIFRAELEQIRQHLGRRAPRERSYKLEDALPRHTYYQSQTLFRKSNQLAQELANVSRQRPATAPEREIVPGDSLKMIQAARAQLAYVKTELGITDEVPTPKLERRRTPSDVTREVLESGNVLNELVVAGPGWTDIYDRVLQMLAYTAGVLPESERYPALPEYVCCKMPQDVYQSFAQSLAALKKPAKSVDYALVRITTRKNAEGGAGMETVYDLTTTMIADIAEITLRLGADENTDLPPYKRPKRILPADVYLLTEVLLQQVKRIAETH